MPNLPDDVHHRWSNRRLALTASLALCANAILANGCIVVCLVQDRMVFPRDQAPIPQVSAPPGVEVINVGPKGLVPAWFMPAAGSDAGHPAPVVIHFHGNAEIIDYQHRAVAMYRPMGFSLLLPEYRGYGRAKAAGSPSQDALVADGVQFYDELVKRTDVDPSRIIISGYSLGGGVAAQVAARRKPAALILEATFTSIASFAREYGTPPCLIRHPFYTNRVLPTLGVPIFISHGRADAIVPVSHGRQLHALVPASTYVELGCGHLDMPGAGRDDTYRERVRKFLANNGIFAGTDSRIGDHPDQPVTNSTPNMTSQTTSRKCQ
jgi:uncharacterized protein